MSVHDRDEQVGLSTKVNLIEAESYSYIGKRETDSQQTKQWTTMMIGMERMDWTKNVLFGVVNKLVKRSIHQYKRPRRV